MKWNFYAAGFSFSSQNDGIKGTTTTIITTTTLQYHYSSGAEGDNEGFEMGNANALLEIRGGSSEGITMGLRWFWRSYLFQDETS